MINIHKGSLRAKAATVATAVLMAASIAVATPAGAAMVTPEQSGQVAAVNVVPTVIDSDGLCNSASGIRFTSFTYIYNSSGKFVGHGYHYATNCYKTTKSIRLESVFGGYGACNVIGSFGSRYSYYGFTGKWKYC